MLTLSGDFPRYRYHIELILTMICASVSKSPLVPISITYYLPLLQCRYLLEMYHIKLLDRLKFIHLPILSAFNFIFISVIVKLIDIEFILMDICQLNHSPFPNP